MVFSYIIPVYNMELYIDVCIESIVRQTYTNFEVILIDDGSSDSSKEKCEKWCKADQRISCVFQQNSGVSAARNRGLGLASGEYVIFLDSDDYWLSESALEKISGRLRKTNADVLSFNFRKDVNHRLSKPYFSCEDMPQEEMLSLAYLAKYDLWVSSPWNKAIRRTLFESQHLWFQEGVRSEDIDWCVRLAMEAKKFDYIDLPVVGYRKQTASASGCMDRKKINDLVDNIDKAIAYTCANKEKAELLQSYLAYQVSTLLYNAALLENKSDRKEIARRTKKYCSLLNRSGNRKVKVMRLMVKMLGCCNTVEFLRFAISCRRIWKDRGTRG